MRNPYITGMALFIAAIPVVAAPLQSPQQKAPAGFNTQLTTERKVALARVDADSLKSHVSFLASDALEGRATPSKGLDLAAEYIASQYRRAGLEPAGDDGYFQTTEVRASRNDASMAKVRNVVGILRGTDPTLKATAVVVSGHYDHVGMRPSTTPGEDVIFNGANDDASGTAGVIELAYALKGYKPKRSIVFVCFYGEERGLLGSRFYGSHPVVPAKDTVAMVNLEQIGRTDDLEGARVAGGSLTGYDFSDVGLIMTAAGAATGVKVDKHPQNSDSFFGRSDNQAMADLGVPAHTLCTAFNYPDYHKAGDHWDKLDYPNMEKVVKMVGLTVMSIADSAKRPQWNVANLKTAKYVEAAKKLVGQ